MSLSCGVMFWRKTKCVGAGISGGVRPGGRSRPPPLWPAGEAPWCVFSTRNSKILYKNHTEFLGHLENLFFRGIFYCKDNSENKQKILILLYLI